METAFPDGAVVDPMTVLLRRSGEVPDPDRYRCWLAVTGTASTLDPARRLPRLAARLEEAFVASRETWWALGRELGKEPSADIAHMPTAGAFGSDFGIMLAWSWITESLAEEREPHLVLCDDPWLFRHLAGIPGVAAGKSPRWWPQALALSARGWLARFRVAARMARAAIFFRNRNETTAGASVLLVYGHPESTTDGHDAYFGDLMQRFPELRRMLHTDCPPERAEALAADGRTGTLLGFGDPLFALTLVAARWRPGPRHRRGPFGWLVRRAAARENGGGGPAMNRWQAHCQARWLARARPARVAWPWENHGWERNLCRAGRRAGTLLIGYQHTVIGPHQFNYATATNPDGLDSIPDRVVADGPAYLEEMAAWGVPRARLRLGGAFRFRRISAAVADPEAPVFVPLSAIPAVAEAQLEAAREIAGRGRRVLVKEHPMYPVAFADAPNLTRTNLPLARQERLSAVLYSTGASGLEARLMGVAAYRLMLEDRIAIDVLPAGIEAPAVTLEDAAERVLASGGAAVPPAWDSVLAEPDISLWQRLLFGDIDAP